ncbi:MAG: sulfur carrier protein ThiS [Lachnospiraceae bacterium]|nr:sulfur carrier protein ThiS [Lachnospiraceae bacterium]
MVTINGEAREAAGLSVRQMLEKEGYEPEKVVVECNLTIVDRADYDTVVLKEEDTVEVLRFVGGG